MICLANTILKIINKLLKKAIRSTKHLIGGGYRAVFNKSIGVVLMLHRVMPEDYEKKRLTTIRELCITPEKLQDTIDSFKDKSYDFIKLDEVESRLLNKGVTKRPFVAFTFDDGYRDNYEFAYPVFLKNNIPFSVFPTVDFINNERPLNYPFIIERIVYNNDFLTINGVNYPCRSECEKESTFIKLKEFILSLSYTDFKSKFFELFNKYIKEEYFENIFMSWEQLREMQDSGLCDIGSHTMSHCKLSNCQEESQLLYELGESKRILEEYLGCQIKHLSYPFGWIYDVDNRVVEVARETGYSTAFISYGGKCRKMDKDIYRIKRLMIIEDGNTTC